jgi:hypothetical protein
VGVKYHSFLTKARERRVVTFTPWPLYPSERALDTYWIHGSVSSRDSLAVVETTKISCSCRESNYDSFAIQPEALSLANQLHGAEPFLTIRQLRSYSRISQYFTEPEGSLPCSQRPSTGPYPEPDQFSPYHPILFQ